MPLGYNKVLGDSRKSAEARPHRVALGDWPTMVQDPRANTIDALLGHAASAGYEGFEFNVNSWKRYFPGDSDTVVARKARAACEKMGLQIFGATLFTHDEQLRKLGAMTGIIDQLKVVLDMGGEFANFQMVIHPDYSNTAGLYREDERYLRDCANQVTEIRDECWKLGLNYYCEVHVDRITEDPAACSRILDMASCELTGDMSHNICRGFTKGKHIERQLKHMGHTHVRMARQYGDLSAVVEDPKADWAAKGVTWQLFQFMKPALAQGLSSRVITGETGPAFLVKDTLTQDAKLVPLYRAMARVADAGAQGIVVKVDDPADLKPWG